MWYYSHSNVSFCFVMGASSPEMFWKWCLQEKMTVSLFFSRNPRKNQNMPWCLKCVGGCKCAMLDLAPLRQAAYCIPPIWRTNVYVNHIYTYILKILRDIHIYIYIHVFRNMFNASFLHIYIYGRGSRFSDRTSIRIIEFEKKQCFTVVKWRCLM